MNNGIFFTYLVIAQVLSGCSTVVHYPLTSLGTGIWGTTGKTPTDHALSNLTGEDCNSMRVIDGQEICQPFKERMPVPVEDRSATQLRKERSI